MRSTCDWLPRAAWHTLNVRGPAAPDGDRYRTRPERACPAPQPASRKPRRAPMTRTILLKWTVLVVLSAAASFVAAMLTDHVNTADFAAMAAGIATFIVFYSAVEAEARAKGRLEFVKALKAG